MTAPLWRGIPNGHFDTSSAQGASGLHPGAAGQRTSTPSSWSGPDAELGTPITPGLSLDATGSTARPEEEANFRDRRGGCAERKHYRACILALPPNARAGRGRSLRHSGGSKGREG